MSLPARLLCSLLCAGVSFSLFAEKNDSISYRPNFHGTLRPRMELSTEDNEFRFQLRNARVSMDGQISPSIDYFIQVDACDRGTMKFLDGWARIKVADGLKFQAGQFRMPFAVDPFRAPHNYVFSNRSFIGKQIFNWRAVGAKVSYTLPRTPLTLEAGVFNPKSISDHTPWNKTAAFASKALYKAGDFTFAAGYASIKPTDTRMNALDGCITWKTGRWTTEAEYLYTHYVHNRFKASHAYNAYTTYAMPIKAGIFNRLSFQGRFDGITAHSSGKFNEEGQLEVTDPARNRITVGTTISYIRSKSMYLDIRADYEKYFYHSGVTVTPEMGDKLVLEMVLRF